MSDGRPLADLTDQQLSDYCGDVDSASLASASPDDRAVRNGELCVAEVSARRGRKS